MAWRPLAGHGDKCCLAGLSERAFARIQHGSVRWFPGVWARIGHGVFSRRGETGARDVGQAAVNKGETRHITAGFAFALEFPGSAGIGVRADYTRSRAD